MDIKRFMQLLDKYFLEALEKQTNWGKNQIMTIYQEAKTNAAVQLLQEMQEGRR